MAKNRVWQMDANFHSSNGLQLNPEKPSILRFEIEIPNEAGDGTDQRVYNAEFIQNLDFYSMNANYCFSTEKFDINRLSKLVLEFNFDPSSDSGHTFSPFFIQLNNKSVDLLDRLLIDDRYRLTDSLYQMPLRDLVNYSEVLFYHADDRYPKAENVFYTEVRPTNNPSFPVTLNIDLDEMTLHTQPFVQLRGGLAEGSETERHTVNFLMEDLTFCFSYMFDLVFTDKVNLIYKSGDIFFPEPTSCLQFKNGGYLEIAENTQMDYGQTKRGILALNTGSTVRLNKGSSFTIYNRLSISEADPKGDAQQIYIDLPPGSKFTFAPGSRLSNEYSIDGSMRLNFRMLGGELDDRHLPAADKQLIRRLYPNAPLYQNQKLKLWPQPTSDWLQIGFQSESTDLVQWQILGLKGQLLKSGQFISQKGNNEFSLNAQLPNGLYLLRIQSPSINVTEKILFHK